MSEDLKNAALILDEHGPGPCHFSDCDNEGERPCKCDERAGLVFQAAYEALKAACLKHVGHEHCVTPCDSMRIQDSNHSAWLEEKERAEKAESRVRDLAAALEGAMGVIKAAKKYRDGMKYNACGCYLTDRNELFDTLFAFDAARKLEKP